MMLIDYMTMKNGDYHEKQITYNMTALLQEIKKAYPYEKDPNLADSKYAHIVNDSAHSPKIMGGLAKQLGIANQVLSLDLWRDISNGYCPASYLTEDSPLAAHARDTPRGKMVVFNRNATPIDEYGAYKSRKKEKGKPARAIGTEFVFGMAGNFSKVMARLMTEDPAIEKQFKQIIDGVLANKILPAMLEDAGIRTGKDGVDLSYAKDIIAVAFLHIENRGVEPYLHVHFDLINAALGFDDKLTSLYSGYITKNKDSLNALFQAEMKERLEQDMGFVFTPVILESEVNDEFLQDHEKNICSYDLPDAWVPQQVKDFYSQRSQEMQVALKGKQGFLAEEIARVSSRDDKTELSPSEMKSLWKTQMDGMGWSVASVLEKLDFHQVRPGLQEIADEQLAHNFVRKYQKTQMAKHGSVEYGEPKLNPHLSQEKRDQLLIDGFLRKNKEVCFSEGQFKAHMVKQLIKDFDKDTAMKEACRIFDEQCVHMLAKDKIGYYADFLADRITDPHEFKQKQIRFNREMQFTTKEVLAQERYIYDAFKARDHETRFTFPEQPAMKKLLAFEDRMSKELGKSVTCTEGQRNTFMMTLTQPGSAHFVIGDAGTGKSFIARGIKEAYEEEGFTVWATAPTNKAIVGLSGDAKIANGQFGSLCKLLNDLEQGKIKWDSKTIVLGDEMGMACQDEYYRLSRFINESGAKLVSIGDAKQIQSVQHGSVFRVMSDHFVCEKITEISRQHTQQHRDMVQDFAYGRSHKAARTLYEEGRVVITATDEEKLQHLVKDYLADPVDFRKKVIVTGTNRDSELICLAIREELKLAGKLSRNPAEEVSIKGKDGINRAFCVGDRLMFTKGAKSDDTDPEKLMNSELGTVKAFRHNKLNGKIMAVQVAMDNGKTIWLSTNKEHAVKHGYANTVAKSQGSTYDSAYYVPGANMDSLHTAYVACSRHRSNLRMYLSNEMADNMAEQMEDKEPTARMLKVANWIAQSKGISLDEEQTASFIEIRHFLNEHYKVITSKEGEPPHKLDDWSNIIQAMSKTQFKKSTFDFEILEGKHVATYKNIKMGIEDRFQHPERYNVVNPDFKPNEPSIVERESAKVDNFSTAMERIVIHDKKTRAIIS